MGSPVKRPRVDFRCPLCREVITAPESLAGQSAECPECHEDVDCWPAPIQEVKSLVPAGARCPHCGKRLPLLNSGRIPKWCPECDKSLEVRTVVVNPVASQPLSLDGAESRPLRRRQRGENQESTPTQPSQGGKLPAWAKVAIGVAGVLFLLTVLNGERKRAEVVDAKVGEEVWVGDVGVTVAWVGVTRFQSHSPAGHLQDHEPELVVQINLKNRNPNRVIQVGGQSGACRVKDDVGNTYREISAKTDFGFTSTIVRQIPVGKGRDLRSDQNYEPGDVVVFDQPVPGASELVVTLKADVYGGNGTIRVVSPIKGKAKKN
jgi:Zn finger protein HypA/HybF involved in hydrogenase expression